MIKICLENREKIDALICTIEKKCTARTIDYQDIHKIVCDSESKMNRILTIKSRRGVEIYCNPIRTKMPGAYKYPAYSTQFHAIRKSADWFLISVFRTHSDEPRIDVRLTDAQKTEISEHAVDSFLQ